MLKRFSLETGHGRQRRSAGRQFDVVKRVNAAVVSFGQYYGRESAQASHRQPEREDRSGRRPYRLRFEAGLFHNADVRHQPTQQRLVDSGLFQPGGITFVRCFQQVRFSL